MKKIIIILFLITIFAFNCFAIETFNENTILNVDKQNVLNDNWIDDPLRNWTQDITEYVNWVINEPVYNSNEAQTQTINLIKWIANYFLSILSLVVLGYFIYNWFVTVTANWDEGKFKKWLSWIKNATIAILWVWLSWFIVSLIVYVIKVIAY